MKNEKVKILSNKQIAPDFYKMSVASTYLAKNSKPGQFVEIRCQGALDPLLRRPFGVHRVTKFGIEMLYEVVGKGTKILTEKQPGDTIEILGPLGNGFKIDPKSDAILIAGGIGVAPLLALAEHIAYRGSRIGDRKNITIIIGARSKSHINCANEFKKLGCKVIITTDDGSKGKKGLVTDPLKEILSAIRDTRYAIYACGPNPMLKAVWAIAETHDIPCQFSFESHMACGIGVCLGCPIKVKNKTIRDTRYAIREYKMVCKDGPVFNGEDIAW